MLNLFCMKPILYLRSFLVGLVLFLPAFGSAVAQVKVGETYSYATWDNLVRFNEGMAPVCLDSKWGYVNEKGVLTIGLEYSQVGKFVGGLACVGKGGKYGYIDKSGREQIPLQYSLAFDFNEGVAAAQKNNKWGYIGTRGEVIIPFEHGFCEGFSDGLGLCKDGNDQSVYTFYDISGKAVLSGVGKHVRKFSSGFTPVIKYGYFVFINTKGAIAFPGELSRYTDKNVHELQVNLPTVGFGDARPFCEGYAAVMVYSRKWSFLNRGGSLSRAYDDVGDFANGYAGVKNGKWGVVDAGLKEVIPCKYESFVGYGDGLFCVKLDGKYGYVDKDNRTIIPFVFESAGAFSNGEAIVKSSGAFLNYSGNRSDPASPRQRNDVFKIDKAGNCIKNCPEVGKSYPKNYWEETKTFTQDLIAVRKIGKTTLTDKEGTVRMPLKYDEFYGYSDGFIIVKHKGKYGSIVTSGIVVSEIKHEYSAVGSLSCGLASVNYWGKSGFVNSKFELVIPLQYDWVTPFENNFAKVYFRGQLGLINRQNQAVIPFGSDYTEIKPLKEGLIILHKNNFVGISDSSGKLILPVEYDEIKEFNEGRAVVRKNFKYGVIDKKGVFIIPVEYGLKDGFVNNTQIVSKTSTRYGVFNAEGRLIIPFDFEYIDRLRYPVGNDFFPSEYFEVRKGKKKGVYDSSGKLVLQFDKYSTLMYTERDGTFVFFTIKGKNVMYFDLNGKLISSHPL